MSWHPRETRRDAVERHRAESELLAQRSTRRVDQIPICRNGSASAVANVVHVHREDPENDHDQ